MDLSLIFNFLLLNKRAQRIRNSSHTLNIFLFKRWRSDVYVKWRSYRRRKLRSFDPIYRGCSQDGVPEFPAILGNSDYSRIAEDSFDVSYQAGKRKERTTCISNSFSTFWANITCDHKTRFQIVPSLTNKDLRRTLY